METVSKHYKRKDKNMKINHVFKTIGIPSITYVTRKNGLYEKKLKSAIRTEGKLCLLTGSSKTGKTTLYNKVLNEMKLEPLILRCNNKLSSEEFWKKALEQINFERIKEIYIENKVSGKIEGKLGWKWLSGLIGEVSLGISGERSESEVREIIISQPSPEHLLPILKELPLILVIEDFHYLTKSVQKSIFQQWKIFVDNEVTVIVVGTSHHAVDIAFANSDLVGRIHHIELKTWNKADLKRIVNQGLDFLSCKTSESNKRIIAEESVGLPIITQDLCLNLFLEKEIYKISDLKKNINDKFEKADIFNALYDVANTSYSTFNSIYEIIATGINKSKSKYNTYEIMLLIFSIDPITFSLKRHQIDERIKQLGEKVTRPPAASINSTLSNLKKLQSRKGIELMEWLPQHGTLYILEPAFLFFLRCREKRSDSLSIFELLEKLSARMSSLTSFKFDLEAI